MEEIYQPREDTFLLARVVDLYQGERALEIGTGSGYIAKRLCERFDLVIATDIDLTALKSIERKENLELILCDSATALNSNIKFDLIVFNPPYLPSDKLDDYTVDGLKGGIEIAKKFFFDAHRLVKDDGKIVFILSSLSDVNEFLNFVKDLNYEVKPLEMERFLFEELTVYQARRVSQ
ncbi:Release factor glutamine methyltransferase [archaeon HR06]|nr:Release factor glutamine methyltransferase [archaeon HR06]